MFTEDPFVGGITYYLGGVITVPDVLGLGAFLDKAYLEQLKKVAME